MTTSTQPTLHRPAAARAGTDELPSLSIVVPVWNDPEGLAGLLASVAALEEVAEVVIADASTDDRCAEVAAAHGATVVKCPRPSRGTQMNAGAVAARGDLLLFHHVDVPLTAEHCRAARRAGSRADFSAAAFYRKFDPMHRRRRWLERFIRLYNRMGGALYGDQSLCIRRESFIQHGGFRDIALMEDVEFTRRLRRNGGIELLDPPVLPSARRHARRGSLYTSLFNLWIMYAFRLGVSPDRLHRWYYGHLYKDK